MPIVPRIDRPALLVVCAALLGVPRPSAAATSGDESLLRPHLYQDRVYVRAQPRDADEVERIWRIAEDVLAPHDPAVVEHELVVTRATLARLQAEGIRAEALDVDVQAWVNRAYEQALPGRPIAHLAKADYGPFFAKVQTLDAITTQLRALEQASGGRATLKVIGTSIEKRELLAMRISAAPPGTQRPSIIVLGAQHAREWASPMVAMGLVDALVRQYDADPKVRRVVDSLEIIVIPVLNPDGYVATFNGKRLQRKNMNPTCNVDLNRNYDAAFGQGTGGDCRSETYPGKAAFSEPETQAVRDLVASLARPRLLIDYHSIAAVVMIPYAYSKTAPPAYQENKALCELYSSTLRGVNGTDYPGRPRLQHRPRRRRRGLRLVPPEVRPHHRRRAGPRRRRGRVRPAPERGRPLRRGEPRRVARGGGEADRGRGRRRGCGATAARGCAGRGRRPRCGRGRRRRGRRAPGGAGGRSDGGGRRGAAARRAPATHRPPTRRLRLRPWAQGSGGWSDDGAGCVAGRTRAPPRFVTFTDPR